jgi:hypothetical protein
MGALTCYTRDELGKMTGKEPVRKATALESVSVKCSGQANVSGNPWFPGLGKEELAALRAWVCFWSGGCTIFECY